MAIEYIGLKNVEGPLAVIEGVRGASYEEVVTMTVDVVYHIVRDGSSRERLSRELHNLLGAAKILIKNTRYIVGEYLF